ncbi:MAG: ATP-binding cassette domain-containing protein, partial [Oscillospiraceae bacterium]
MDGEIKPESGAVYLDDQDLTKIPKRNRPALHLAFGKVWQEPRLMRKRTIGDNLLPVVNCKTLRRGEVAEDRVTKALGLVGMPGVEDRFPVELSGGECRRVELARAIINSPHILLLDELTGNLDEDNIWDILYLLGELNRQGTTVIMATHARQFVNILRKRVITMVEGRVFGDVKKGRYGDLI